MRNKTSYLSLTPYQEPHDYERGNEMERAYYNTDLCGIQFEIIQNKKGWRKI